MSSPEVPRELVGFEGAVRCQPLSGAVRLRLLGRLAASSGTDARESENARVLFSAIPGLPAMPAELHDVRVLELSAAPNERGQRNLCIEAREGRFLLPSGSLQIQRDCARAFYAALPEEPVPFGQRLGWRLLLRLLHLPGAARLLERRAR